MVRGVNKCGIKVFRNCGMNSALCQPIGNIDSSEHGRALVEGGFHSEEDALKDSEVGLFGYLSKSEKLCLLVVAIANPFLIQFVKLSLIHPVIEARQFYLGILALEHLDFREVAADKADNTCYVLNLVSIVIAIVIASWSAVVSSRVSLKIVLMPSSAG